jgi:hypothetical protein
MACYCVASRLLTSVLIGICLAISEVESRSGTNHGRVVRGMYLMAVPGGTGVSFRTYDHVEIEECAKECALRTKCLSFNYAWKVGACELNDFTHNVNSDITTSPRLVARSGFMYSEKDTWPKVRYAKPTCRLSFTILI